MSAGFSDSNIVKKYLGLTAGSGDAGLPANYFKLTPPVDSASAAWPVEELVMEMWDGTNYRILAGSEWQYSGAFLYAYPVGINWASVSGLGLTAWRRLESTQEYAGEDRNALSPQAIAAQLDKTTRLAQIALEAAMRALQEHPLDPGFDEFTGKNLHPSNLTIPPYTQRQNALMGFDATGLKITMYAGVPASQASVVSDPGKVLLRDAFGRTQVADPSAPQDVANKNTVDVEAAARIAADLSESNVRAATDLAIGFDLIIDSNAKLDLWCQNTAGAYRRVLIKTGTWTSSITAPVGNIYINLNPGGPGTVFVQGEKGSVLVFNPNVNAIVYGISHPSGAADPTVERFESVSVTISNSFLNREGIAFYKCANLTNCVANGISQGAGFGEGFDACINLVNCVGTGSSVTGTGQGFGSCTNLVNCVGKGITTGSAVTCIGFNACTNLTNCSGSATSVSGSVIGYGFRMCANLVNCSGTANGTGFGFGFWTCTSLFNCTGTGNMTGSSTGAAAVAGFYGCIQVIGCSGQGLNPGSGPAYGFNGCQQMQQNKASGASKTSTYNSSFADVATNACAATAAGGYNL